MGGEGGHLRTLVFVVLCASSVLAVSAAVSVPSRLRHVGSEYVVLQ